MSVAATLLRRRGVLAAPILLPASASLLAGCATQDGPGQRTSAPRPSPALRVVTLDPFSTQDAYDLGVAPVAGQDGLEQVVNAAHAAQYRDLPRTGTFDEPNVEAVAAADPDLILASSAQQGLADQLTSIAPTTFVTAGSSSTWKQAAEEVAAALGTQDALAALRAEYEERAEAVRAAHAGLLGRTLWALVWLPRDEGIGLRATTSNCGQVFSDAGVRFVAAASTAADGKDTRLSWELLDPLLAADVIALPADSDGAANVETTAVVENGAFAALPAARAGRLPTFPHFTPGSYRNAVDLLEELDVVLQGLSV